MTGGSKVAPDREPTAGPAAERRRIGLFFKPPRPGAAKTRLSPHLPAPAAARLYRAFIEDTIRLCRRVPGADITLFHGGDPGERDPQGGIAGAADLPCLPQYGADLGERMAWALGELLRPPAVGALLLGTDTPDLPAELVSQAFYLLEVNDMVLGPASDGGYYLVGLTGVPAGLFSGISWSTDRVLAEQRTRARELGLRTALLPPWDDVDDPADLAALRERLARTPGGSPATRRVLKQLDSLK